MSNKREYTSFSEIACPEKVLIKLHTAFKYTGKTQTDIARRMGFSLSALAKITRGTTPIKKYHIFLFEKAFNIPYAWFVDGMEGDPLFLTTGSGDDLMEMVKVGSTVRCSSIAAGKLYKCKGLALTSGGFNLSFEEAPL